MGRLRSPHFIMNKKLNKEQQKFWDYLSIGHYTYKVLNDADHRRRIFRHISTGGLRSKNIKLATRSWTK